MPKKHIFSGQIAPDAPFMAVGDIHGRADLLRRLLDRIAAQTSPETPLVCVGDYVDRGEQSAEVLQMLRAVSERRKTICLRGNHEEMLLNFLEDPARHGPRWMRYGGLQTIASYAVAPPAQTGTESDWEQARDALAKAMGRALIDWLYSLPLSWQSGNVTVVHAALDPARTFEEQDPQTLVWGHPAFFDVDRSDGLWVVHGHTIVDNAAAERGRISLDTGAYATGVLSAALIAPEDVSFEIA